MFRWLWALSLATITLAQDPLTVSYFTEPNLLGFPFNVTTQYADLQTEMSNDAYFLTCFRGTNVTRPAPAIYDVQGNLIWMSTELGECFNLQEQTLNGEPVLTVWVGQVQGAGWGLGTDVILDSTYNVVKNVTSGLPTGADIHEFNIPHQTNSTAMLTTYNPLTMDLSPFGGPSQGWMLDSLFMEVDIESGNVLFNWSALDHLPINETFAAPGPTGTSEDNAWDFCHINSIDKDADGNYLVSSRHYHQLYKIDKSSGDIIWRLGGKTNNFQMGNGTTFFWQHHARWHENFTRMSVFDNGASTWESDEATARGLYLAVDTSAMTVSLVQEFLPIPRNSSQSQGSVQLLDNGNFVVGFGSNQWIGEYTPDGNIVYFAIIGPSSLGDNDPIQNYRAIKTTTWSGRPSSPPSLAAINGTNGLDVYVSWNGATHVATYNVFGGSNASSLTSMTNTSRSSFETHINMAEAPEFVAVAALSSNGVELGRTGVVEVSNGAVVLAGTVSNASLTPAPSDGGNGTSGGGQQTKNGAVGVQNVVVTLWVSVLAAVVGSTLLC